MAEEEPEQLQDPPAASKGSRPPPLPDSVVQHAANPLTLKYAGKLSAQVRGV